MLDQIKKINGKVLMAALAGTVAGMVTGLLMAPQPGAEIRDDLSQSALQAKSKINDALQKFVRQQQQSQEGG